jgi:hypothetical protein
MMLVVRNEIHSSGGKLKKVKQASMLRSRQSTAVSGRDKLSQKWSFKSEPLLGWSC